MTDLQTLDALHARLDAAPGDWATRLVLADLLTDLGRDDEGECQRWMAGRGRHPWKTTGFVLVWAWVREYDPPGGDHDSNVLPRPLWALLEAPFRETDWFRWYHTRSAAEADLLAALRAAGEV